MPENPDVVRITYVPSIGRYRDRATGRFISRAAITAAQEGFMAHTAEQLRTLTNRFTAGEVTADAWEARARVLIKDAHVATHALGRGGRASMTKTDRARAGGRLSHQYRWLREFRRAIERGDITSAQARARAALYATTTRRAANDGRLEAAQQGRYRLRWDLGQTEQHCESCSALAGSIRTPDAWESSPVLPQSSSLACGGWNCDCRLTPAPTE